MEIQTNIDGTRAIIELEGKLTVQTSPELSKAIEQLPDIVSDLDIDLTSVDYIASAGLRVIVSADKLAVKRGGVLRLLHPCDEVMEVLEMTGLSETLAIVR